MVIRIPSAICSLALGLVLSACTGTPDAPPVLAAPPQLHNTPVELQVVQDQLYLSYDGHRDTRTLLSFGPLIDLVVYAVRAEAAKQQARAQYRQLETLQASAKPLDFSREIQQALDESLASVDWLDARPSDLYTEVRTPPQLRSQLADTQAPALLHVAAQYTLDDDLQAVRVKLRSVLHQARPTPPASGSAADHQPDWAAPHEVVAVLYLDPTLSPEQRKAAWVDNGAARLLQAVSEGIHLASAELARVLTRGGAETPGTEVEFTDPTGRMDERYARTATRRDDRWHVRWDGNLWAVYQALDSTRLAQSDN